MNNYEPLFTYIIPFRFRQDRIIPLRRVLDWLSGFQNIEVIIVEQDKHSKIKHLNLKAKHIFVKNDGEFNKSWSYNLGMKRSLSPVIICGEADFIMNPNDLIESLNTLQNYDCILPLNKVVNLSPQESNADFNTIFGINNFISLFNSVAGVSIYKKEALQKIAGWNEDFIGSNYENKFQEIKIKKILNYKKLEFSGFHFHHQVSSPSFQFEQRNKQIYDFYIDADFEKIQQHVSLVSGKIGVLNKFVEI